MKKHPANESPPASGTGNRKTGEAPEPGTQQVVDAGYLHRLEEENRRLKLAVADLTLRNQSLKLVVGKKW